MLRPLRETDIPDLLMLSDQAGWNQLDSDWRRLLRLCPATCFGVEEDGKVVSTATLSIYGKELAWVGMVLTHHDYRRRGHARALCSHILAIADEAGVESVALDATEEGRLLYTQLGFRDEQPVERWHRLASTAPVTENLDQEAFGADRHALLTDLGGIIRPGAKAWYVGPLVARTLDDARCRLRPLLENDRKWYWDLAPANADAVQLATELGFAPLRRLVRMVRGADRKGNDRLVYALAGFEWG